MLRLLSLSIKFNSIIKSKIPHQVLVSLEGFLSVCFIALWYHLFKVGGREYSSLSVHAGKYIPGCLSSLFSLEGALNVRSLAPLHTRLMR